MIKNFLNKVGTTYSQFLHTLVAMIITFILGLIFKSSPWVLVISLGLGIGKEIWTKKPSGTELAYSGLGMIPGYLLSFIL